MTSLVLAVIFVILFLLGASPFTVRQGWHGFVSWLGRNRRDTTPGDTPRRGWRPR